jgi:hydrogenase expression/formation protein HypC
MCLAIPGKVVEFADEARHLAVVDVSGVRRKINIDLLEDDKPAPGDWVLIHVGFAMSKISEAAAQEQLRLLTLLGDDRVALEELEGYDFGTSRAEEPS